MTTYEKKVNLLQLRIEPSQKKALLELAGSTQAPVSWHVRQAISEYIKRSSI